MVQEVKAAYEAADFPQVIRLIDRISAKRFHSLKSLFKDEQRRILDDDSEPPRVRTWKTVSA